MSLFNFMHQAKEEEMSTQTPAGGAPAEPEQNMEVEVPSHLRDTASVVQPQERANQSWKAPAMEVDEYGMDVDENVAPGGGLQGAGWAVPRSKAAQQAFRGQRQALGNMTNGQHGFGRRAPMQRNLEKFSVNIPPTDNQANCTMSNLIRTFSNRFRGRNRETPEEQLQSVMTHILQNCKLPQLNTLISVNKQIQCKMTKLFEEEYNKTLGSQPRHNRRGQSHARPQHRPASTTRQRQSPWNFLNIRRKDLETRESPHYARESLNHVDSILSTKDKAFALHLIQTCTIMSFKLPEYNGLTKQGSKNREYDFEMHFAFGYNYADNCEMINAGFDLRKRNCPWEARMPADICNEIAKMLGNSRFEILLKVYFDKTKNTDWHEQDGEAWIYHPYKNTKESIDLVNFDRDDRIYYVENWPETGLLSDTYSQTFPDQDAQMVRIRLERTMITWVCSQITWLAFQQSRNCSSFKVRNRLSKLLFVLKGWYTGLLLGESFDPEDMHRLIEDPEMVA